MSRLSPIVINQDVKNIKNTPLIISMDEIKRMNTDTSMMAERAKKEIADAVNAFKENIRR